MEGRRSGRRDVLREYDACEVRIRLERIRESCRFIDDFGEIHRGRGCESQNCIGYGFHLSGRHHRIVTGRLDVQRSEGLRNFRFPGIFAGSAVVKAFAQVVGTERLHRIAAGGCGPGGVGFDRRNVERFGALDRSTRAGETVGLYRRGRCRFRIDVCEQCGVFEGLAADRSQRVARDGQFGQLRPVGERTRTDRHDRFRNGQVFDRVVRCEGIVADSGEACTELERSDIGVVAEGSVTQRGNVVGQGECRQAAVGESTIAEGCHARTQCQGRQLGTAFESARADCLNRSGNGDGRNSRTAGEHFGRDGRCRTEGNGREFGTVAEALFAECRGRNFCRGKTGTGECLGSDVFDRR